MKRTYDIFADNGLFVLSYYIKKEIEDITLEDIENNVELMGRKVEEFLNCDKYSNLKTKFLPNSTVSNPSLKNVKLETQLKEFLSQKGEDYCMICGNNHANMKMDLKGRSYLPNRSSGTFFNFSNNLHNINVCPYCLLLTVYSVMNSRVNKYIYLYNSSDNEFMVEFTARRQEENRQDILMKAGKLNKTQDRLETFLEMIDYDIQFDSQIEIYRFDNYNKSEDIADSEKIYSRNIKLLRKMRNKSLLNEFRSLGLTWMIIDNKLNSKYIEYIYDFDKEKLKCSEELYDFLNKEINMMDKETMDLIDRIANNISESDLDIKKIRNGLRSVNNLKSFKSELMQILEMYYEKTEKELFNKEEYNKLTNIRKYLDIKNMMIIDLI